MSGAPGHSPKELFELLLQEHTEKKQAMSDEVTVLFVVTNLSHHSGDVKHVHLPGLAKRTSRFLRMLARASV